MSEAGGAFGVSVGTTTTTVLTPNLSVVASGGVGVTLLAMSSGGNGPEGLSEESTRLVEESKRLNDIIKDAQKLQDEAKDKIKQGKWNEEIFGEISDTILENQKELWKLWTSQ